MMGRLTLLAAMAGCYSPSALPGSPCNPSLPNCPEGQACVPSGGSYVCATGPVTDAATGDGPTVDAPIDALRGVDASPDAPGAAAWTLIQTAQSSNSTSLNLPATGAGHLVIVAVETTSTISAVADNAANMFTEVPMGRATAGAAGLGVDLWYLNQGHAGATMITVIAPSVNAIVAWEVDGVRATSPLDTAAALDDQAATTAPLGASVTTAAAGEFVVSVAIVANAITGIHAGNEFTNDRTAKANGWAHLTSASAPAGAHQARWDQPTSGVYCTASAAFFTGP